MTKQQKIRELKKQIRYEEKKLEICGYGTSDLMYIEGLYNDLAELQKGGK